jgi:hypothetical protein
MIPLYGFLEGDSIGLLVLAQPADTAVELTAKLQSAAAVRVRPLARPVVFYEGKRMPAGLTVAACNMVALDRFDVREERP